MRNLPVSFTADNFIIPLQRRVNIITIPYILAGIGSGIIWLRISPISDIAVIIANCDMYFIVQIYAQTSEKYKVYFDIYHSECSRYSNFTSNIVRKARDKK